MFWLRDDQAKGMYRPINISVIFVALFPMTITYPYENVICNVTTEKLTPMPNANALYFRT